MTRLALGAQQLGLLSRAEITSHALYAEALHKCAELPLCVADRECSVVLLQLTWLLQHTYRSSYCTRSEDLLELCMSLSAAHCAMHEHCQCSWFSLPPSLHPGGFHLVHMPCHHMLRNLGISEIASNLSKALMQRFMRLHALQNHDFEDSTAFSNQRSYTAPPHA